MDARQELLNRRFFNVINIAIALTGLTCLIVVSRGTRYYDLASYVMQMALMSFPILLIYGVATFISPLT